jgi:FkbM family methyltransferase
VLAARLVGREGAVYAFEPHPANAARIRKNSASNGFAIQVVEAAVCDAVGDTTLRLEGVSCPSIAFGQDQGGVPVATVTVDHLIAEQGFRPPDYVVIDAEGAELRVLDGMMETLRNRRPVVLVEVHWLGRAFEQYCESKIRPLGYVVQNLEGGPLPQEPKRYHALLLPS